MCTECKKANISPSKCAVIILNTYNFGINIFSRDVLHSLNLDSLRCSEEAATDLYTRPDESNLQSHTLFFNIHVSVIYLYLGPTNCLFHSDIPITVL
jgi:hypothetical protein